MRLCVRMLGLDLFDVEISTDQPAESDPDEALSGGSTTSYPIGFTPTPGDQRWERGVDYE